MPSDPPETEDWDLIDRWTRRVGRWMLVGVPVWIVLLAGLNQSLTGIPWIVGLATATVIATAAAAVADQRGSRRGSRTRLGPFGRGIVIWAGVFLVFALIAGSGDRSGAAVVLIPFVAATTVAAGVELVRRARGPH